MTEQEARRLLPQTVVMWKDDPMDKGTVLAITEKGIDINWELVGPRSYHFDGIYLRFVSLWQPEPQP
jgi:hypothetical protein